MAAVFSSALKSNASKVPTRFSKPTNQTNYPTNPTSTPVKPTKFKRSLKLVWILQQLTDEAAEIHPRFLFKAPVLIIHMCLDCRMASRLLEMKDVDGENQHLAVNLCKVCRSTFRSQRRVKFFQHDLPCFKRQHDIKKI